MRYDRRFKKTRVAVRICACSAAIALAVPAGRVAAHERETWIVRRGEMKIWLDPGLMKAQGLSIARRTPGATARADNDSWVLSMEVVTGSRLELSERGRRLAGGALRFRDGVTMSNDTNQLSSDRMALTVLRDSGSPENVSAKGKPDEPPFQLRDADVRVDPASGLIVITTDELMLSPAWAHELNRPALAEKSIGVAVVRVYLHRLVDRRPVAAVGDEMVDDEPVGTAGTGTIGPDVVVFRLQSVANYGSEFVQDRGEYISAFAVGTTSCNIGDEHLSWVPGTNKHPVISQSMFRLSGDRFEHIGLSWLKHGFFSVNDDACGACIDPGTGFRLGVGCSDPYSAALNGSQNNLGPRSDVNAHTGEFPFPFTEYPYEGPIARRLQVRNSDLEPSLNPDALYFVQGHYVMPDDAAAGNADNNISYRAVDVRATGENVYGAFPTTPTQEAQAAIRAWQDHDPDVVEMDVHVPNEGLFIVAAKSRDLENGFWRYEYAVQNVDSDRSGGSFSVPLPEHAVVQNMGFNDVDHHSGEIYDSTDWSATVGTNAITWSTTPHGIDPNANALRWGTLYNFRFDVNAGPAQTTVTLGLFKLGTPGSVMASVVGPVTGALDCNQNGIADVCDVDCSEEGCGTGCGTSHDCNGNLLPDDCEPDCNETGIADECEIADGTSDDCDENDVPDECDPDCDNDGTPDACEAIEDTDEDGVVDCEDECPDTSPPGSCACPATGLCCCPSGICLPDWPVDNCIELGCTPDCVTSPCRRGCLIGDFDKDGDLDLYDAGMIALCFSGDIANAAYVQPVLECLRRFDFDDDLDVDLVDHGRFQEDYTGPNTR